MANEVRIRTTVPGAKQSTKEVTDLHSAFTTLQKQGAKGLGIGIGAGATIKALDLVGEGIGAVTDYIGESIHAASDLNETLSKSNVVFGEAATKVERFGSTAADSFGVSKRAAIEAAASFGNVFTGVGIAQEKAADMSTTLVKLAGDLASFNNIDPTEALEKLRSGLAGEAEPLRSVGVFLTEAQVKAKAMKLGLADAHGELSEGAKILARYQLILEQTKTAQGDFARTSDGVANTERKLQAEMEDREALIGQKMIPLEKAWQQVRLGFADTTGHMISALDAEHNSAQQNLDDAKALLNIFNGLGDAIIPAAYQLGNFTDAQGEAAAAALRLSEHTDSFTDSMGDLTAGLKKGSPAVNDLTDDLRALDSAMGGAAGATDKLASAISEELFGKAINAGHEQEIKDNIKDLQHQRREVEKGSPKWVELTGKIAEQEQALFDLHLEEAKSKGPLALLAFLSDERKHFIHADEKAKAYLATLMKLAALQYLTHGGITFTGIPTSHHASGGYAPRGEVSVVGEKGPELFVSPGGSVVPNNQIGGMTTGAPQIIPLPVPMNWTPAQQAAWINESGPAIVKYLRDRRLV